MTLSKLAQLANVSVSVVSKAFSGREDVSEAMREHVFAVAREHGCFQQFYHVPYDKPVVAVIIPEVISQHYIYYMEALKKGLEESGYTMLLSISNFDPQMKEELVRYYTEHGKVDALIGVGGLPRVSRKTDTVLISIGGEGDREQGCHISQLLESGLTAALSCLKAHGHRRIAYVGESLTASKSELMERLLAQLDLPLRREYMICSRFRFEKAGEDGVERLWRLEEPPTAIIGAYGYITQGILSALSARGISVPRDVSVISMDNNPNVLHPALDVTCIPSGIEQACRMAIEALHGRLGVKNPNQPQLIELPTDFHLGETVAPAR